MDEKKVPQKRTSDTTLVRVDAAMKRKVHHIGLESGKSVKTIYDEAIALWLEKNHG